MYLISIQLNKKEFIMVGYPITYEDTLEKGNSFTNGAIIHRILKYCSKNAKYIYRSYMISIIVLVIGV